LKPLLFESTKLTPYVYFNPDDGRFEMSGYSRPENIRKFYKPLFDYIDNFQKELEEKALKGSKKAINILFVFKFTYINSVSTKFLCEFLAKFERLKENGVSFSIKWYYEENDEDMCELGVDISNIIRHPFNFYTFDGDGDWL